MRFVAVALWDFDGVSAQPACIFLRLETSRTHVAPQTRTTLSLGNHTPSGASPCACIHAVRKEAILIYRSLIVETVLRYGVGVIYRCSCEGLTLENKEVRYTVKVMLGNLAEVFEHHLLCQETPEVLCKRALQKCGAEMRCKSALQTYSANVLRKRALQTCSANVRWKSVLRKCSAKVLCANAPQPRSCSTRSAAEVIRSARKR